MEYKLECGCYLYDTADKELDIIYCPLHKSAPALYEALEGLMKALEECGSPDFAVRVAYNLAKPALAKAEGKQNG